jgi:peptide deformylase
MTTDEAEIRTTVVNDGYCPKCYSTAAYTVGKLNSNETKCAGCGEWSDWSKPKKLDFNLVIYPNDFLRFKAVPFNADQIKSRLVKNIAGTMIKKMYEYGGVGLAAQQVGVPNQIFVMDYQYHQTGKKRPRIFINPIIQFADDHAIEVPRPGEGCLSLPYNFRQPIPRHSQIQLNWRDIKGIQQSDWFEGFEAIVIQHEIDHLNGHIFPDRLSRLKRDMFERKVKKIRRQYKKGYKAAFKKLRQKAIIQDRLDAAKKRRLERETKKNKQ